MKTTPTPARDINAIHETAIERLARIIFTTRLFCGDERSAISNFLNEEEETEEIRFTNLERAAITFRATFRAYEWSRSAEGTDVVAGKGWRILRPWEYVEEGDELKGRGTTGKWRVCIDSVGKMTSEFNGLQFRRRLSF